MAAEARQKQEFQELNKEQTYYRVVQALVNSAQQGLAEIKDNLVTRGATYFVGGLFVLAGQMSVGALLGFLRLYTNLIEATQMLAEITVRTQDSYPGLQARDPSPARPARSVAPTAGRARGDPARSSSITSASPIAPTNRYSTT